MDSIPQSKIITEVKSLERQQELKRDLKYRNFLRQQNRFDVVICEKNHTFINDCYSDSINDCMATIDQLKGSVIWINFAPRLASDLSEMAPLLKSKVRAVFSFGHETGFIFNSVRNHIEFFVKSNSLSEALILADLYAVDNDNIVFAPGAVAEMSLSSTWKTEFKNSLSKLKKSIY